MFRTLAALATCAIATPVLAQGGDIVGVVHSVIRSIAPSTRVLDITHSVDAYDVRAGSLALARAASFLVPGVVLESVPITRPLLRSSTIRSMGTNPHQAVVERSSSRTPLSQ